MTETNTDAVTSSNKTKILSFLRLDPKDDLMKTVLGSVIGTVVYLILAVIVVWPEFKVAGMLTVSADIPMVSMIVIAAFTGPLAGLVAGFAGSLCYDFLFTQQIIALGSINLAIGMIGFIAGIPRYAEGDGFTDGKKLAKLILFAFAGFLLSVVIFLVGLLFIAGQSVEGTLLYNFLPFFSVSLISLLLVSPVAVRVTDIVIKLVSEQLGNRGD